MNYPLSHFIKAPELHLPSEILKAEPFSLSDVNLDPNTTTTLPDIILGKQAEFLFSEIIKGCVNFKVLQENIQINHEKRTIGELDYILENQDAKETIHVELACKFYLLKEDEHEQMEGQWIGPNLKDTLLDKINKFREHQFPLLYHETTKEILASHTISEVTKQHYCIKAQLFVPENHSYKLPTHYNNCVVGVWKKHENLVLDTSASYAIPSKRAWLLPQNQLTDWSPSQHISELIDAQIANKRSPLVYEKLGDQISSFFVVWW